MDSIRTKEKYLYIRDIQKEEVNKINIGQFNFTQKRATLAYSVRRTLSWAVMICKAISKDISTYIFNKVKLNIFFFNFELLHRKI